ncbi:flippase [archaeon]|nr:flippase [archaeon]
MNLIDKSLRTLTKGAGIFFVGIFLSKILTFLYRIIVARLGTEQYGLLSLGLAITGILSIIALCGMDRGVLRYVSYYRGKDDKSSIKGTIVQSSIITFGLSLIIFFIIFFGANYISENIFHNIKLTPILRILSFTILLTPLRNIYLSVIKAFKKVQYDVYSRSIMENLIKIVFTIIFIYFGLNIIGAAFAYLIAVIGGFFLSFYFLEKKIFSIFNTKITSIIPGRELFSYSWPLLFVSFLISIMLWVDTFMLSYFRTVSEVGIYNVSLPTAQLMYVFPQALMILFLPLATELYAKNNKKVIFSIYKIITKWIFLFNIILLASFILFSENILNIFFGESYIIGSSSLIILSFGYFINYLTLGTSNILMAFKKTKLLFFNSIIITLINILLNWYLIPIYGIEGAAIATSLSFLIWGILLLMESYFLIKIIPFNWNFLKILFSISIALIVISFGLSFFENYNLLILLLSLLILLLIYSLLLIITKAFGKEDFIVIKMINQKLNWKFLNNFINKIDKK